MKKENNRWISLIAGTLMLLFLGLIYAWSIFKKPFSAEYPDWTLAQISMTFTISMIFFCLGAFVAGNISKKLGTRKILWLAALLLLVGFFGVSALDPENPKRSLYFLYFFYGVLGGGGVGIGYNVIISSVGSHFQDRAGLASGIMLLGFGLGGIALGSVVGEIIEYIGIFQTFRVLGIAIATVMFIGAYFIPSPKTAEEGASENESFGYSAAEMLRQPEFWIFVSWTVLLNSASLLVINSAASIAEAFGLPAALGLIVSLFNGAGRVVHGAFYDRYKERKSLFLNNSFVLAAGISLICGAMTGSPFLILVGLMFSGLGYGGTPTLSSAVIMNRFGPKNFAVNFSIANFSLIPASIFGPMISSILIENAGGKYDSSFVTIVVLAAIALILRTLLKTEQDKR